MNIFFNYKLSQNLLCYITFRIHHHDSVVLCALWLHKLVVHIRYPRCRQERYIIHSSICSVKWRQFLPARTAAPQPPHTPDHILQVHDPGILPVHVLHRLLCKRSPVSASCGTSGDTLFSFIFTTSLDHKIPGYLLCDAAYFHLLQNDHVALLLRKHNLFHF